MWKVTKRNVTIELWDLGGQGKFQTMWECYCRGVSAILGILVKDAERKRQHGDFKAFFEGVFTYGIFFSPGDMFSTRIKQVQILDISAEY